MLPVKGWCYYEHPDWWRYVASLAGPRIVVIQDADHSPGVGALFGEAYARISRALGCVACVTNAAVGDVPGIRRSGSSCSPAASRFPAYAHVVEFGDPVEIGGLRISSGDLLHGDLHGVHAIPIGAAHDLAGLAEQVLRDDRELFALTETKDFSVNMLSAILRRTKRHLWE